MVRKTRLRNWEICSLRRMKRARKMNMSFFSSSVKEPVDMLMLMEFERSMSSDFLESSSAVCGLVVRLNAYLLSAISRRSVINLMPR